MQKIITCLGCGFEREKRHGKLCRDCYNKWQRETQRERRASDPEWREHINALGRESYQRHAERIRAEAKHRYATDPAFKAQHIKAGRASSMQRSITREERRKSPPSSKIYFVQESIPDGFIKIGYTTQQMTGHRGRLSDLQNGNPRRLVVLATMPGTKLQELELHHRFDASRAMNEWFHPTPDLLAYIAEVTAQSVAS